MEPRQLVDLMFAALYTMGAAVALGLGSVELLDYNFADSLTEIAGYEISVHIAASLIGLVGAFAINTPQWGRLPQQRRMLIGVSVALLAATVFLPDTIGGLADQSVLLAFGVLGVQTGGYWAIAHDL